VDQNTTADYTVALTNPLPTDETYDLSVDGLTGFTTSISSSVLVPAGQTVDVPLQVTVPAGAVAGTQVFEVDTQTAAGASDSVEGQLTVTSTVDLPGVNLSLSPSSVTAGQGTTAIYTVTVTNVGNETDTYNLTATGLPAGIQASFSPATITVPPGQSNFRDVTLTLTPAPGTAAAAYPFTVTAVSTTSSSATAMAQGTLTVVSNGVSVALSPGSGPPGTTFQMTVTNTGTVADTYNLALAGPAALVATLGQTTVTLAPGASQQVTITTGAVTFAVQGALPLSATATSQTNSAVVGSATAALTIPASVGLTTQFTPASQTLAQVGPTTFLLMVNNTGNVQDSYSATITGSTGPITASLMGLDGQPTQTIPIFILPGLSTGAIMVQANLTASASASVTVQVVALDQPNESSSSTADINFSSQEATTTAVTSNDQAGSTYGQTVTFTATVSASSGTPTGQVQFELDGSDYGTPVTLTTGGMASIPIPNLSAGQHSVTAFYTSTSGTFNNSDDSASPWQQVVQSAPLTITASNQTMTYGGTVPSLTYTYTGLVNSDTSASFTGGLTTTATSSSNVAGYSITQGTLAATGNYKIGTFNPGTLTVNPASLTVTATNESMTYGGTVPALAYTYSGLVNGNTSASFTGALATTASSSSNVGGYSITQGNLAATGNYTIGTFNAGTLTVNAAKLTVTATSESMTYGGSVPALAYTYTGLVNGNTSASFTGALATAASSSSTVGGYSITQGNLTATANYTIGTFNAGTLTVNAAKLTVTATSESMTYGGTVPALAYTYSGLVNGNTSASFTGGLATTATSSSNVGGYAITQGTLAATGNYTIGTFNTGTLTVNAAKLTVTATSESMTYGGSVPALTYTYSGLVNGNTSASFTGGLTTTATSSSNVGGYAITEGTLAATGNYTIGTFNGGTLTVNAAKLTVTATSESMTYGGTVPALTYTYSGLVNGNTSAGFTGGLTTTASSSSNVGGYSITQGTLAATGNYTIGTYNAGTLTVNAAPLTVSASNESMTQGGTVPALAYTYTGLVNGNTSASFTGSLATTATSSSSVGSYPITQGTLAATGNYKIGTFNPGTLNVTVAMNGSIIVLDPSAGGALTISGNASISIPGGVHVDSSSSSALSASGNIQIKASVIDVHGGVQKSGNASFSPAPTTGAAVLADPLAALASPSTSGPTNFGSESLSGNSSATIKPGIYSQISASGNGTLTLNTGLYIIEGGGFTVSGNASIVGSGVTIFNAGGKYPSTGGTYGSITLSGNGSFSLTPPTSGTYAGIVIFQSRDNSKALTVSGNASGTTGTIYAPAAQLVESGNAQLNASLDVDLLSITGSGTADAVTSSAPSGAVAHTLSQIRSAYGIATRGAGVVGADTAHSETSASAILKQDVQTAMGSPLVTSATSAIDQVLGALQDDHWPPSSIDELAGEQLSAKSWRPIALVRA